MRSGATICYLGYRSPEADLDFTEAIGISPVTQARMMMQNKITWGVNTSAMVDERTAMNLAAEKAQPEQPPAVQRLWRPTAEERPAKPPEWLTTIKIPHRKNYCH